MAYSKTPSQSTYQTKKLSLFAGMNSRGSVPTKDVDYVNCYAEELKNKTTKESSLSLRKRNGSTSHFTIPSVSTRGVYFWEDQSKIFIAQGNDLLVYQSVSGVLITTLVNIFPTTTTGDIGFSEFLYDTGVVKLVVTDGITLSTVDTTNVVAVCVDPDMPVHLPQPVFMDGYLFLLKTTSSDLYNSNLNDPLLYTAGDFISSELFPDTVTNVWKLNNYIVLFGTDSIEYFWDAANATGSPLQRNDTPVKLVGLRGGVAQLGNKIYFVGDADHSQSDVYVLEDFKITSVGDEVIRRWLAPGNLVVGIKPIGNIISMDGHDFYALYDAASGYTYVLEINTMLWSRWTYSTNTYFDFKFVLNCQLNSSSFLCLFIKDSSPGNMYKFDPHLFKDSGLSITTQWTLANEYFDTYNQKYMYRLTIWADKPDSTSPILVQWSDNDYQTFNTGQTLDLFQEMPCIYRMGRFRRRAFRFTHTADQALRINDIEVDYNLGQT